MGLVWLLAVGGCSEVTCPEPLNDVDGTCQKPDPAKVDQPDVERCDGVDNDGDDEVDEDWPELGERCGERAGVGECVEGTWACSGDGLRVVCEGGVLPSKELCDGKDNDCDGSVDEGVMSVKTEVFDEHATVTAVDGGFLVTRVTFDQVRVETYGADGNRTGHHDGFPNPNNKTVFLESDGSGQRAVVALGDLEFQVAEAQVDSDLIPIVLGVQKLHSDWDQGITYNLYYPPYNPRVSAAPPRFLGHVDLITFALSTFSYEDLSGLAREPAVATTVADSTRFDADGSFVVWEQGDHIRAGILTDSGEVLSDIDVARGINPGIAVAEDGPGVAYLSSGALHLSELGGATLQCHKGGFCNERIDIEGIEHSSLDVTGLALDEATDTWFVLAGTHLAVVGRDDGDAILKQAVELDPLGEWPRRVDVEVSDGTAAVVQVSDDGESALTFLGCF